MDILQMSLLAQTFSGASTLKKIPLENFIKFHWFQTLVLMLLL